MPNENAPRELALLSNARNALASAETIDEITQIRDKAQAAKAYAKKAKLGFELVIEAAAIKLTAERKLGTILKELPLATGGRKTAKCSQRKNRSHDATGFVQLRDLGLNKSESSRAQQLASLPEQEFQKYLEHCRATKKEASTAAILRLVRKKRDSFRQATQSTSGGARVVNGIVNIAEELEPFSTVYADPPWCSKAQESNGRNGFAVEQLCQLPIAGVCAANSHLHIWCPRQALMPALTVMEAWGFQYRGNFAFVGSKPTKGHYWRDSHRLMLLGVRGQLPFTDRDQPSWLRNKNLPSQPTIRSIVEAVSPPPYLQLFGWHEDADGEWTVFRLP